MKKLTMPFGAKATFVALALTILVPAAQPYDQYSLSRTAGDCADCHGGFRAVPYTSLKGGTWTSGLHDTHRTTMLSGDCGACHAAGGRFPVSTFSSSSAAPFNTSCLGCHGRVEGGAGLSGRGLRQHHQGAGVTDCLACHADSDAAAFPVVAESVKPPLYITNASHPNLPKDPCNPPPLFPENFAGTTLGLDNDGNGLYDVADPACAPAAPAINLNPGGLSFGDVAVGTTSAPLTSAIMNTGTAPLTVIAIALCSAPSTSAEFAFTAPVLPFDLPAGGSANLRVTYAPTGAGTDTGCVAVTSNASNGPTTNLSVSGTGVVPPTPTIGVAPTSLAFGDVTVGTTSAPRTLTVSNTGTATLTGTIALAAGTSTEFAVSPTAFSIPAGGASVSVTVTYAPAAVGGDTGSLLVSSNDAANPTVAVALSGAGVAAPAPSIALVPSALSFGTVTLGGSASLTTDVRNGGTADLVVTDLALGPTTSPVFTWSPAAPFTVAAGGSATVTVTFTPTSVQDYTGSVVFTSNAATSPTSLSVSGMGQAASAPRIAVSPSSLAFGNVTVGTVSAAQAVTVSNTGTATLTGTIALGAGTSAEFGFTPAGFSIPAGAPAVTVTVNYAPTAVGSDTGALLVTSNDTTSPTVSVGMTGAGVAVPTPAISLVPNSLSFGPVTIGLSSTLTTQLRNTGTAPLDVTGIARCAGTSLAFTWSASTPFTVQPGQLAMLSVTYAPTAVGPDSGCLAILSNDPASPSIDLGVSGTGAIAPTPAIAVNPTALDFGTVTVGTSSSKTFTVSNTGDATLTGSIALVGGTSLEYTVSPATFSIAAGAAPVGVTVTYAPVDTTTDTGSVEVNSNDPARPIVSVSLIGTGAEQPVNALDVDIVNFLATPRSANCNGKDGALHQIDLILLVRSMSAVAGCADATLIGVQNGVEVYRKTRAACPRPADGVLAVRFPSYDPRVAGEIVWTVTVNDQDPDVDVATAKTAVFCKKHGEDSHLGADFTALFSGDWKGMGGCSSGQSAGGFLSVAALALLATRRRLRARGRHAA
jgi:hypothetical protein